MTNWNFRNKDGVLYFVQIFVFGLSYFYGWPYGVKMILLTILCATALISDSYYSEHNVFMWRNRQVNNVAGGVMATLMLQSVLLNRGSFSMYDQAYVLVFVIIQYWESFKKIKARES